MPPTMRPPGHWLPPCPLDQSGPLPIICLRTNWPEATLDATITPGDEGLASFTVEDHIGFLLRRAHQRHVSIFTAAMARADLTPTQFTALLKVVQLGRTTQNLLGRHAAMDPATIQGVVRRLMARGLVHRGRDPMDRRTAVLEATEAGVALVGGCRGIRSAARMRRHWRRCRPGSGRS